METQTIKANISGKLFEFERDAYNRLEDYLNSMRTKLNLSPNEIEETISDMEIRIAELLSEKIAEGHTVIKLEHVIRIISILGEAEQIEDEAEPETKTGDEYSYSHQTNVPPTSHRRLFRLNNHRILGGVCSGIAEYLNIDSVWIRLIFIISLFISVGTSFLIYIILWAIIPNEKSYQKKNSGRYNYEDIKQNVRSEYERTKSSFHRYRNSGPPQRTRGKAKGFSKNNDDAIGSIIKIGLVILAVFLFAKGIMWITGAHHIHWQMPHINMSWVHNIPHWFHVGDPLFNMGLFGFLVFLLIFIPVVLIIVALIKAIFNVSARGGVFGFIFMTIWVLVLVLFVGMLMSGGTIFNLRSKMVDNTSFDPIENKTLVIKLLDEEEPDNMNYYTIFNNTYVVDNDREHILRQPEIKIRSTHEDEIRVKIEKSFLAFEDQHHHKNQLYRDFDWYLDDSVLVIDNYYEYDMEDWWQQPELTIIIYLPEDQRMEIDEEVTQLMNKS